MPAADYDDVLRAAEDQLWADLSRSRAFIHRGLAGTGREIAVADFLSQHLGSRFAVTTGEALDTRGKRSTELDIAIYDSQLSTPLVRNAGGPELLPAEALLAVVEVKTTFTGAEADRCARAARSIARLRPYDRSFINARTEGASADDGDPRCLYSILAFASDLSTEGWAEKEWARLVSAAKENEVDVARIDRLSVLDRGLIVPPSATALPASESKSVLRDWFVHLADFLHRESARRKPYELADYTSRANKGWVKLEGYKSPTAAKRARRALQAQPAKPKPKPRGSGRN